MKLRHLVFVVLAASMPSVDSIAQPGAPYPSSAKASAPVAPEAAGSSAPSAKMVIPELKNPEDIPAFDSEPFPSDKSKTPKPDEWKAAPEVRVTRVARSALRRCRAYRVREWLRVHCNQSAGGVRLIAGSASEVVLWVDPMRDDVSPGKAAEAIFPVRIGDRRIFELFDFNFGDWGGLSTETGVMIEEQWLPGMAKPEISLLVP